MFYQNTCSPSSLRQTSLPVALTAVLALLLALPPRGFSAHVDNPWFPLRAGTVYVYRGVKDGKPARDVVTVTHKTVVIDAAPCVVVRDRLYLAGKLEERTLDWYSQDRDGNVWYFGEQTAELDARGNVKTREGSWRAGHDGALPGVYMPAHPVPGRTGRQEFRSEERRVGKECRSRWSPYH